MFDNNAILDESPDRPLLSRVADSMFWMSRYVERAEQHARLLKVNTALLMDVGELAPAMQPKQWQSVLDIARVADPEVDPNQNYGAHVARYMTFDPLNPGSLVTCLSRARENARAVRSDISAEMWRAVNAQYLAARAEDALLRYEEQPEEFYDSVMNGAMMFAGISDHTLSHDQRWHFIRLGRSIERAEVTCRVIEARFSALMDKQTSLESSLRNIQWMAVLRMCCSIEAYRRMHVGDLEPVNVAAFLIFERDFPRSVFQSVRDALGAISGIRRLTSPRSLDPAERVLGRLSASLEFTDPSEFSADTVGELLQTIRAGLQDAANLVTQTYFRK